MDSEFVDKCIKKNIPFYKGPVGEFNPSSLEKAFIQSAYKRFAIESWLPSMNKLESIAAAFVTGVADEKVGFEIIGRTYCSSVAQRYDLICLSRNEQHNPYFNNIVKLYAIWSPRISKAELESMRQNLDAKIANLPDNSIPPIKPKI